VSISAKLVSYPGDQVSPQIGRFYLPGLAENQAKYGQGWGVTFETESVDNSPEAAAFSMVADQNDDPESEDEFFDARSDFSDLETLGKDNIKVFRSNSDGGLSKEIWATVLEQVCKSLTSS
jgi:hypothetical protein